MQLIDYVTVLRRRWWVILLTGFVAAVAAYGFSKLQTPVFRSEATYSLTPSRFDNGLAIVLQNSMNSIRDEALAPVQLEKISSDLRLDLDANTLLKDVTIQPQPDSWKMVVQVDFPRSADTAQKLANAVGTNMVALVGARNATTDSSDKIYMSVLQPARFIGLTKPNTKVNVAAGALLGLILGLLLAFVLEATDNSLKTPADVERFVGLTTLGVIPTVGTERKTARGDPQKRGERSRPASANHSS